MGLVDAHCHFDFPVFDARRKEIMTRVSAAGVSDIVIPGVRREDWSRVVKTAFAQEGLHYCLGIHPWFIGEHSQGDMEVLRDLLSTASPRCVGLGECGLDRLKGNLEEQQPWFEAQIELAQELDLALVVHSVKTHDEVATTLKRKRFSGRVLIHGFSGSEEQARKLAQIGCFIGIGGVITYERARKTRNAVAALPLNSIVLETDAPDMAPAGVLKGRNSPEYLPQIVDALAEVRSEPRELLLAALRANVKRLYGWP
ncbi:MAG: TatD family hydrolase [Marinobacter sp.]|uniref:TatD family hydrolase n=1 Tax=Marinobacter sp. TaxID=50741 RepID=UPI0034A06F01